MLRMKGSKVGIGTWKLQGRQLREIVQHAVRDDRVKIIDCAYIYKNQTTIGDILKETEENGQVVKPKICSKLWNHSKSTEDDILSEFKETIGQLNRFNRYI